MLDRTTVGARAGGAISWEGETVFIVAGGASVAEQDLECLRGRRVIAIKGSYLRVPSADVLLFADSVWWRNPPGGRGNGARVIASGFAGEIVTTSPQTREPFRERLTFRKPSKTFSDNPSSLFVHRTVVTAAVNEAFHRKAARSVLLGVDGVPSSDGRFHHYPDDQGRQLRKNWQTEQAKDFAHLAAECARHHFPVINASPVSVYDFWPRMKLEELC
jgi:hypothetical protein